MKNKMIQDFLLGILIAFTIAVIILSAIMAIVTDTAAIPVSLIWQAFVLSILCSLINLVYRSEKLRFVWQSIIGYVLTTGTIILSGLIFGWYDYRGNSFDRTGFILISFLVYSLFYLITWIIIWRITKARGRVLNAKLEEYKQRQ